MADSLSAMHHGFLHAADGLASDGTLTRMGDQTTFTRRDVSLALLATAIAMAGGKPQLARDPVHLIDFAIAGGHHHGLRGALDRMAPGTRLALVREAANVFDADAVALHLDGVKLGYIPRSANTPVARLLDRGAPVHAQVLRMLGIRSARDVPDELVFAGFASGDPMIRQSV
jgi:HIRAN domain